eukprot:3064077-Heterocapsa_arctica.AAC.1
MLRATAYALGVRSMLADGGEQLDFIIVIRCDSSAARGMSARRAREAPPFGRATSLAPATSSGEQST